MKKETETNNIACPYCLKILTAKSFEKEKWRCEHCGASLKREIKKEYAQLIQNSKSPEDF